MSSKPLNSCQSRLTKLTQQSSLSQCPEKQPDNISDILNLKKHELRAYRQETALIANPQQKSVTGVSAHYSL